MQTAPPQHVELRTQVLHVPSAFDVFLALREVYGERSVYLLESLGGPTRDRERALIGLVPLATIEATDDRLDVSGRPEVAAAFTARICGSGAATRAPDGSLTLTSRGAIWTALRAAHLVFDVPRAHNDRFGLGFLAVLGYDAVRYMEDLPRTIPGPAEAAPEIFLQLHSASIEIDLRTGAATLTTSHSALWESVDAAAISGIVARVVASSANVGAGPVTVEDSPPCLASLTTTQEAYAGRVRTALDHIRIGDVYQVQIGHEVTISAGRDDLAIYQRMREQNPSPYMAFLPLPDFTLMSASPELHVLLSRGGVTMRPIAGTVARIGDDVADAARVRHLTTDEKERAEHVMLVDLCRNDLGRIAVAGSVTVTEMMHLEPYSHVFHLVSTVTAAVEPDRDVYDVIRATFPAGTMTGAPKIRAMEIIEDLETSRRGLYAGAFGVIGLGGFAELALSIRTIVRHGDQLSTRASAGIVLDSTPEGEWLETLAKMNAAVVAATGRALP